MAHEISFSARVHEIYGLGGISTSVNIHKVDSMADSDSQNATKLPKRKLTYKLLTFESFRAEEVFERP